jgi:quinol-cytochrome oxidoreductase complex cytochrome b subunit
MGDVIIAFRIAILTYILGILTCGLVGIIILIVRKITSNREEGVEQI